ncbi:glycosyltransferase [Desulfosporosinus sp. BG]|uniref:glycosyltransferase family 2 protein n=1 Tax=Desulfosporosinus sp. BG TaxID=1633135 RepID=UPI00083B4755|nr:glycosyltransferase [Desulfosporosinus sp. BG]ODA40295.1 Glycosyltransferase [Desulfosporosinus sp. BG]
MLLSIIIPIFNPDEADLQKCINSILAVQNIKIEIIMIDDGSDAYCELICNRYVHQDNRVLYYRQENKGVSAARNKGIEVSKGHYIMFIDSDDYIDSRELSFINELNDDTDTVLFNYNLIDIGKLQPVPMELFTNMSSNSSCKKEVIYNLLLNETKLNTPWAKIYSNEIIKNYHLKFPIGIHHGEDLIFNLAYFRYAKNIIYFNNYVYNYKRNINGLTAKIKLSDFDDLVSTCDARLEYVNIYFNDKNKIYNYYTKLYNNYLIHIFRLIIYAYFCKIPKKDVLSKLRDVKIMKIVSNSNSKSLKIFLIKTMLLNKSTLIMEIIADIKRLKFYTLGQV